MFICQYKAFDCLPIQFYLFKHFIHFIQQRPDNKIKSSALSEWLYYVLLTNALENKINKITSDKFKENSRTFKSNKWKVKKIKNNV